MLPRDLVWDSRMELDYSLHGICPDWKGVLAHLIKLSQSRVTLKVRSGYSGSCLAEAGDFTASQDPILGADQPQGENFSVTAACDCLYSSFCCAFLRRVWLYLLYEHLLSSKDCH